MDGTGQDGARLHISGLFVGFVTGLPQLLFPVLAAVFGVRKADNPALLPILRAKWEVADKMLNRGVPMSQVSSALDLGVTEYRGWDVGLVPSSNVPVSAIADGYSDADLGLTGGGGA